MDNTKQQGRQPGQDEERNKNPQQGNHQGQQGQQGQHGQQDRQQPGRSGQDMDRDSERNKKSA